MNNLPENIDNDIDTVIRDVEKNYNNFDLEQAKLYDDIFTNVNNVLQTNLTKLNKSYQEIIGDIVNTNDQILKISDIQIQLKIIKEKLSKKSAGDNYKQYPNIIELNKHIPNINQNAIINRISTDADYAKVYLQKYEVNINIKKPTLMGTIRILGNYNASKKIREAYDVKILKNEPKGTFWCSCADHKFNSSKKNIVCKHICFIVCKVALILQPYFFETKTLSTEHLELLLTKISNNSEMWKDKKLVRTSNIISIKDFEPKREIDELCTFCYDALSENDREITVSCPLCKNCFHIECQIMWLDEHEKCSCCFNDFWKYFKRIQKGENEILLGSNEL